MSPLRQETSLAHDHVSSFPLEFPLREKKIQDKKSDTFKYNKLLYMI